MPNELEQTFKRLDRIETNMREGFNSVLLKFDEIEKVIRTHTEDITRAEMDIQWIKKFFWVIVTMIIVNGGAFVLNLSLLKGWL